MRGYYVPNQRRIAKKVHHVVNDLYWLISNSGSVTQYPSLGATHEAVVVGRHIVNVLTMDERTHILYLAVMYRLDNDRECIVHFEVTLPETEVSVFHDIINSLIIGILNADTLLSDCGVVLNRHNFIKYAGLIGYTDQYEINSTEESLYKMMLCDTAVPPSTYEGIRLLESSDFLGEFLTACKPR